MLFGAMNHPAKPVLEEVQWIAEKGFDFIDLTLEPPLALPEQIDLPALRRLLQETGLKIVGHTCPFLPIASPYERVRQAALEELLRSLDAFAELGVTLVNLHVDHRKGAESAEDNLRYNLWTAYHFAQAAQERNIQPVLEHFGLLYSRAESLRPLMEAVPSLGFHLDVGHANLWRERNATEEFLSSFTDRLCHVHISDNLGGDRDLHLPLGAGQIDWPEIFKLLKKYHYDRTVTLEVFSREKDYLWLSLQKAKQWWQKVQQE